MTPWLRQQARLALRELAWMDLESLAEIVRRYRRDCDWSDVQIIHMRFRPDVLSQGLPDLLHTRALITMEVRGGITWVRPTELGMLTAALYADPLADLVTAAAEAAQDAPDGPEQPPDVSR